MTNAQTPPAETATKPPQTERPGSPGWWREMLLSPDRLASLERVATPHLKPERAIQCLTSVLMIRNSELLDCLPASISVALQTAVASGLEPGVYMHFIPFKQDGVLICQAIADYRGMIRIAMRSPLVAKVEARAVFPDDDFRVEYGDEERIHHVPNLESAKRGGTDLRFAYAIVTLSNGQKVRHVMTRAQLELIKGMAKGSGSKFSPWSDPDHGYIEMCRKTVTRACLKYVPVEESVARQISAVDQAEFDFENRVVDEPRRALPQASATGNAAARGLMDEINNRRAAEPAPAPRTAPDAAEPQRAPQGAASPQAARTAPTPAPGPVSPKNGPVAQNWSGRPQTKPAPAPAPPARTPLPEINEEDIPF